MVCQERLPGAAAAGGVQQMRGLAPFLPTGPAPVVAFLPTGPAPVAASPPPDPTGTAEGAATELWPIKNEPSSCVSCPELTKASQESKVSQANELTSLPAGSPVSQALLVN